MKIPCSHVTDTVSIPDQEKLNKGIEELVKRTENVNDCDDILAQISQDPGGRSWEKFRSPKKRQRAIPTVIPLRRLGSPGENF